MIKVNEINNPRSEHDGQVEITVSGEIGTLIKELSVSIDYIMMLIESIEDPLDRAEAQNNILGILQGTVKHHYKDYIGGEDENVSDGLWNEGPQKPNFS